MSRRQTSLVQIFRSRFRRFRDQGNNCPPWAAFPIRQTCVNARTSKLRLLRSSIWMCRCRASCDRGKYDNMKQGLQSLQSLDIVDMAYMCGCTNRKFQIQIQILVLGILSAWEVILILLESTLLSCKFSIRPTCACWKLEFFGQIRIFLLHCLIRFLPLTWLVGRSQSFKSNGALPPWVTCISAISVHAGSPREFFKVCTVSLTEHWDPLDLYLCCTGCLLKYVPNVCYYIYRIWFAGLGRMCAMRPMLLVVLLVVLALHRVSADIDLSLEAREPKADRTFCVFNITGSFLPWSPLLKIQCCVESWRDADYSHCKVRWSSWEWLWLDELIWPNVLVPVASHIMKCSWYPWAWWWHDDE